MLMRDDVLYEFHHIGIPSSAVRDNERYSPMYRMYTSDGDCELARVQYHRFEVDSPLHPLMRTSPHVAFKVDDLEKAVLGKDLILGPYEPIDGFRVAVIDDHGFPVELIQTALSDEEVWGRARSGTQAALYRVE